MSSTTHQNFCMLLLLLQLRLWLLLRYRMLLGSLGRLGQSWCYLCHRSSRWLMQRLLWNNCRLHRLLRTLLVLESGLRSHKLYTRWYGHFRRHNWSSCGQKPEAAIEMGLVNTVNVYATSACKWLKSMQTQLIARHLRSGGTVHGCCIDVGLCGVHCVARPHCGSLGW